MTATYTETRWYVGPVDEIETRRLDGTSAVVARGEPIQCSPDDAAFYDLQPDNWSAVPPEAVTAATVDEVLAAVGDDPDKAADALAAEQTRPHPRRTLVDRLQQIIDNAAGPPSGGGTDGGEA